MKAYSELINTDLTFPEKVKYIKARCLIAGVNRCTGSSDWEPEERYQIMKSAEAVIRDMNKRIERQ